MKDKKTAKKGTERYGIPETVEIGFCTYKINFEVQELMTESLGSHNRRISEINIQTGLPRSVSWVILFREILKIINSEMKDVVAEPLANSLFSFIEENHFPRKDLPKSVKIGSHRYSVKLCNYAELEENSCGTNSRLTLEIKVRNDMKPDMMWDIFFHESLHGINQGFEESEICYLSTILCKVLDNLGILIKK